MHRLEGREEALMENAWLQWIEGFKKSVNDQINSSPNGTVDKKRRRNDTKISRSSESSTRFFSTYSPETPLSDMNENLKTDRTLNGVGSNCGGRLMKYVGLCMICSTAQTKIEAQQL